MEKTKIGNKGMRACHVAGTWLFAAALLLGGCSKEPTEAMGGPTDGQPMEITLSPESMGEVAMDTRAVSGVDENRIKDLWVIQFNADGTALLQTPQYITTVTSWGTSYKVRAKIIKTSDSSLYFIANTGDNTLYSDVTTAADVESKTLAVTNEASLAPGNALPMCGCYTGKPSASVSDVAMKRAVAKVTFKLAVDIPGDFALTSVKVYNAPTALQPFRDTSKLDPGTSEADCYPATSVGFIGEFADLTPEDKTLTATAKECGWCYLPENGRGTGSATDQRNKTAATALGGAEGQGNYATYIEIVGDYTSDLGYKYTGTIYRIYLGADAVSNYDVKRNTHYTVTATIKGVSEMDARITIGAETLNPSPDFYDYTDNLTGWFVYARTDASTRLITWQDALLECAKTPGWRLPTMAELEIIYCMRDTWEVASNGFYDNYYWSATEYDSSNAWYVSFSDGISTDTYIAKNSTLLVRCVRGL